MEEVLETDKIVKELKSDVLTYISFAQQFLAKEQFKRAITMCDKALQLEPDNSFAKQLKARIIKAQQSKNPPKVDAPIIDM